MGTQQSRVPVQESTGTITYDRFKGTLLVGGVFPLHTVDKLSSSWIPRHWRSEISGRRCSVHSSWKSRFPILLLVARAPGKCWAGSRVTDRGYRQRAAGKQWELIIFHGQVCTSCGQ